MRGKHCKPSNKLGRVKLILLSIALIFVMFGVISGTLAWLIADTKPVVNTFSYGDINITLEETDTNKDGDNDPNTNNYPMKPGNSIEKDPLVTFKAGSEDAWLFVKLEKSANFDDFMTYETEDGWNALDGESGIYYRSVDKVDTDTEFYVIKDNTVKVKGEVTKEMLNALDADSARNYPTLTVTAYAVQRDSNFTTAADAWAQVVAQSNP